MKRKFLILTLCFTIVFSSINYKKSYAFDGGVISVPMLATLGTLVVASGVVLSSTDDLYDVGRLFYDRHKENWDNIETIFKASVVIAGNKVVSVGKDFLDICKETFDLMFNDYEVPEGSVIDIGSVMGIPIYPGYISTPSGSFSNEYFNIYEYSNGIKVNYKDVYSNSFGLTDLERVAISKEGDNFKLYTYVKYQGSMFWNWVLIPHSYSDVVSLPYSGSYNWDNVGSKENEDGSVDIYVPGNLGTLVGNPSVDVFNPSYELPDNGSVSIPTVDNPSIGTTDDVFVGNPSTDVPDVDVPDTIIPSFPSFGDSLDFSPMYLTNVTEKFPFSLPWDVGRLINLFDVEPIPPIFDVPIVSETVTLDLTEFSDLAAIVRFFVLIGFILSLIFISTKLMA